MALGLINYFSGLHCSFSKLTKNFWVLAKRTRKSTQIFNLLSTCGFVLEFLEFFYDRRAIARTWEDLHDDLHWLWSSSNYKSIQVFHRLVTQRRSTQVDRSELYMRDIYEFLRRELASRLANSFGHLSQVRMKFWLCKLVLRPASTRESIWPGL